MMSDADETARRQGIAVLEGDSAESIVGSAREAREADRELAAALDLPGSVGEGANVGYLRELGRQEALSQASERELILASQKGDRRARARLVEAFMPLIASVARLYRGSPRIERVELLQEGVVGLLRALERYDPDRGTPFWAYASWWVRQAMQQLVSELTRPVVLSDRALRDLARLRSAHEEKRRETGREPGAEELAASTGLAPDRIEDLLSVERPARSTEEEIWGGDGAVGSFGELLVDPLAEGEYERVLDSIEAEELLALLAGLSERERAILRARYGLGEESEQSLRQLAERHGLSAERVRQIEQRALGKLAVAAGGEDG
jgi:RNA polymerase sigma factor (sigma-70 family)